MLEGRRIAVVWRVGIALGALGAALLVPASGRAEDPPERLLEIIVAADSVRLSGFDDTESSSVDLLARKAGENHLIVGAGRFRVGDARWSAVRVGGGLLAGSSWYLDGDLSLGSGSTDSEDFSYSVARGAATLLLGSNVHLKLGAIGFESGRISGTIGQLGAAVRPAPRLSYELVYSRSFDDALGNDLWTHRLDLELEPVNLFAGVSVGSARIQPIDLLGSAIGEDSTEWFAGFSIPTGLATVIVAFDRLDGQQARRDTVTLALRIGLARSSYNAPLPP